MSGSITALTGKLFPLNLTFQFSKTEIGTLLLDVLLSEKIKFDGKVTQYPVEEGSVISDHVMPGSKTLYISGTTSNAEAYSFNFASGKAKLIGVLETMEMLKAERKLITVTTALAVYRDMGIETLEATRSNNGGRDGNWIDVSAELRRVKKVVLRTADVAAAEPAAGRTGTTRAPTAANATTAASATTAANPNQSLAIRLQNYFRATTGGAS